ncbi:hypothetical protein GLOIN_2v1776857 [Rhizophagus clarus]|uniref:F-box domain-containing protein n=1 Tax=Rhizophagus clarus TaxID=94130 RepID=A0A8H3L5R6_9GLOM|nr:hypothetical protein GLOIN_2v1776857 [Rhizophagus clarus]
MACTKIFSGDLPEIINEIIQYFQNDFSTLHSCVLVNRLWCRLAIPLLWENPFSLKYPKNYHYIEVYLHNINEDDKTQLNEYGINNDLFPSNTLFNYTSFIHHLDTYKISNSIEKWVSAVKISTNFTVQNNNELNYKKLIYRLLFQIFIENKVKVYTFKVKVLSNEDFEYFNDTIELILQNSNFICDIRNLTLDFDPTDDNITKFMIFLYSNCNSISSLYFLFPWYYYPITEKHLSQIIESQQNLKKISLCFNNIPLYHSLLSLKNSNCINTLSTIIFYHVSFKNVIILNEVFEQLNVLESIHILYCYSLDSNFIQQISNLTKPFKLRSLFMNEPLSEPLQLLLQKSGDYLENFGFEPEYELSRQEILEIIKYCSTKIKFLKFSGFNDEMIYKIFDIIEKVELSLNYLTIEGYDDEPSSTVLQCLGQILPSKLEYLSLSLKRAGYLAFLDYFYIQTPIDDDDLYSLKNEVKEFRLHNIIIQNYYDLNIEAREFINEMY